MLLYLGGSAIREIYSTVDDEDKTFESATEALNSYFVDRKNLVFERYLFNTLKQKPTENSKAYIVRLKKSRIIL